MKTRLHIFFIVLLTFLTLSLSGCGPDEVDPPIEEKDQGGDPRVGSYSLVGIKFGGVDGIEGDSPRLGRWGDMSLNEDHSFSMLVSSIIPAGTNDLDVFRKGTWNSTTITTTVEGPIPYSFDRGTIAFTLNNNIGYFWRKDP